jgi:site-specific recombinase XerD
VVFTFHRWLERCGIELGEVTLRNVYEYLEKPAFRPLRGRARHEYQRRLRQYVVWLDEQGHLTLDASLIGGRPTSPKPEMVEKYVATLESTLKPSTCQLYRACLREFLRWLADIGGDFETLSRTDMQLFFAQLKNRGLQPATRVNMLQRTRVFLRALHDDGILRTDPDALIRASDMPKVPQYLPRPIPPAADRELQRRLAASDNLFDLALLLMRRTGLRISELRDLAYDCVRTDHKGVNFLKVPLGKLNNERLVPLDDATMRVVERLRAEGGYDDRNWLMQTPRGTQPCLDKYRQALACACGGLNIPDGMTSHRLRHTYATSLLNAGMSLLGVMRLLGHRNHRMTLRYAEVTQETVGREYFEALTRIEKRYEMGRSCPTVEEEFDPADALAATIRWLQNHLLHTPQERQAKLLIRRLERARKEVMLLRQL